MKKYYRQVAASLRQRGVAEGEILATLNDIEAHSRHSGKPLEEEFGDATAFAEQFPRGSAKPAGRRFTVIMTVLAAVFLVGSFVAAKLFGTDLRVGALSIPLFGAVAIIVIGTIGGFMIDRRLPKNFEGSLPREY